MSGKGKPDYLDEEEKALIESAETRFGADAELPDATRRAALNASWQTVAASTAKRKSVTLRLQERDIEKLKAIAYRKGLPYQTLISSILHQYADGDLIER